MKAAVPVCLPLTLLHQHGVLSQLSLLLLLHNLPDGCCCPAFAPLARLRLRCLSWLVCALLLSGC